MKQRQPTPRPSSNPETSIRSAFVQRLKTATAKHDIGELASKIGVTSATLYRWLNGKFDPSLPKLAELATATNVSLAWLVTGAGPMDARQALRQALLEGYARTDFAPASGKPAQPPLAFHEPWLFELLYTHPGEPTELGPADMNPPLLMEMDDDSMEPTIEKGDLLLIDRSFGIRPSEHRLAVSEGRSEHDGIYAFRSGSLKRGSGGLADYLIIRRLQFRLDGTVAVRCDNPKYPEEIYLAEKRPAPVGRLRWRATRL